MVVTRSDDRRARDRVHPDELSFSRSRSASLPGVTTYNAFVMPDASTETWLLCRHWALSFGVWQFARTWDPYGRDWACAQGEARSRFGAHAYMTLSRG